MAGDTEAAELIQKAIGKVRRKVPGNFTFLLMTDRQDLDGQIYRTFVGSGIVEKDTPRAASGADLEKLLKENHRYIFSLIHKFNQDVDPKKPYSERDDIIVISDEAHRTQSGRLARNMRLALPNAAFIGFTGTPLFKQDEITKRIFGGYVSRYDFKRSEEDGATVKLVYENRGEKLGLAHADLNARMAEKIEEAELDPDQAALLDKLLGKDYEIITADERLDKIAADFVEHCATRWESGKSLFVCIDKITCARMLQRLAQAQAIALSCKRKAEQVEKQVQKLLDRVVEAGSESVIKAYEKRIAALERQALVLREKAEKAPHPKQSFDDLFELALNFLASPLKLWSSGRMDHRKMVLRLTFAERLRYCPESGFRTPKTTFPFSLLADVKAGIEQMAEGVAASA